MNVLMRIQTQGMETAQLVWTFVVEVITNCFNTSKSALRALLFDHAQEHENLMG